MAELKEYPENGNLEDKINWFLEIDPETLINRENFGGTFVESSELFSEIQTFLSNLEPSATEKVINRWGGNLHQHLQAIKGYLDTIIDPNLRPVDAGNVAQNCQANFPNFLQNMVNELSPYSALLTRQKTTDVKSEDIEHLANEMKTVLTQAQDDAEQIKQVLATAADEAGKAGIAAESRHFSKESDAHHKNATWWLYGVVGGGFALLGIAGYFYFCEPPPEAGNFDWNHFVPRFSILGLLIFFEVVLIGNYKAERHNSIVNKHRANALNTFETMTAATITPDVKDAVTLTAAGAIYAPQETGFRGGGSTQMQNPAEILAAITQNRTE